jgi:tungstate transport system substrate-binding protein
VSLKHLVKTPTLRLFTALALAVSLMLTAACNSPAPAPSPTPTPSKSVAASIPPSPALPSSPAAPPASSPAASPKPSTVTYAASPPPRPSGETKQVILATTTSTKDSGLLDVLIPIFQQKTGYVVLPIAVGSGAAMAMGQRGEADVLLVHAPASEVTFMKDGYGTNRQLIMHNDYIIVGPAADPGKLKGTGKAVDAFKKIADSKSVFISRGDNSGTNQAELAIWKAANITADGQSWYTKANTGMGATLNIASEKAAYTMTDRATFLANKQNLALDVLVEGDPLLLNIYHVIQVNQEKFPVVNAAGAKAFSDFMISPETQKAIGEFGVAKYGAPLFFPDYGKKESDLGSV